MGGYPKMDGLNSTGWFGGTSSLGNLHISITCGIKCALMGYNRIIYIYIYESYLWYRILKDNIG